MLKAVHNQREREGEGFVETRVSIPGKNQMIQKKQTNKIKQQQHQQKQKKRKQTVTIIVSLIKDIFFDPLVLFCYPANRAFSHDVTVVMLASQTNPMGVELFSYMKTLFCSNKFKY